MVGCFLGTLFPCWFPRFTQINSLIVQENLSWQFSCGVGRNLTRVEERDVILGEVRYLMFKNEKQITANGKIKLSDACWQTAKSKRTEWTRTMLWQLHGSKHRPAVGGGATGMPSYEGGGLAHAAGWGDHAFLCMGAWHWTGPGGHQEAFRVILTPAAAKVATAWVTEAPPFEPAHQALGNNLVKTFPVLLGNEDPGKHFGIRHNLRLTRKTKSEQRWRSTLGVHFSPSSFFFFTFLQMYQTHFFRHLDKNSIKNSIKAAENPLSWSLNPSMVQSIRNPPPDWKTEGILFWLCIAPTAGST